MYKTKSFLLWIFFDCNKWLIKNQRKMLSSSVPAMEEWLWVIYFVFCCRFIKESCRISGRGTQSETSTLLLSFPQDDYCIIRSRGKPRSLLASLYVCSHIFQLVLHILDRHIWPLATVFTARIFMYFICRYITENILCIPSRRRSCQIWSDPVGWRRWWGGWRGETQAAICTRGPVMGGPNTSRSALTGTCTLPGSRTRKEKQLWMCFNSGYMQESLN